MISQIIIAISLYAIAGYVLSLVYRELGLINIENKLYVMVFIILWPLMVILILIIYTILYLRKEK